MESNHHTPHTTPKDFFLHLGVMVSLYAASISLLTLLYSIIDFYFPDHYGYGYFYSLPTREINASIAALFVIYPAFLILARYAERDIQQHPHKKELWIRRWLVYLTLFVAGITMAVDLIVLIRFFLEGELTTKFLMKVVVVFFTSGAIFKYFLYDLKRSRHGKKSMLPFAASAASCVVIATLVLGFSTIGSPFQQRSFRLDEIRIQNLSEITQQIIYYRQNYGDVPETLNDLGKNGFVVPQDPDTAQDYPYTKKTDMTFELCASFERPTRPIDIDARNRIQKPIAPGHSQGYEWGHPAGRTCFAREIFPDQVRPAGAPFEKPAPAF